MLLSIELCYMVLFSHTNFKTIAFQKKLKVEKPHNTKWHVVQGRERLQLDEFGALVEVN